MFEVMMRIVAWWVHQDSNLGPAGYEPVALTAELWTRTGDSSKRIGAVDGKLNRGVGCRRGTCVAATFSTPDSRLPLSTYFYPVADLHRIAHRHDLAGR